MAYRFNGGYGAVTCYRCDVIIDEGIDCKEYERIYGPSNVEEYCQKCAEHIAKYGEKEKGLPE